MILVILAILLIPLIYGIYRLVQYSGRWGCDDVGTGFTVISGLAILAAICVTIFLGVKVSELSVIDKKIKMYEEENTKIETQIAEVVEKYQEYETGIFTEVDPESSMTLVSIYPNLKADALVEKQIETYVTNNDKIKSLKEDKINGKVYRWWLYFGG